MTTKKSNFLLIFNGLINQFNDQSFLRTSDWQLQIFGHFCKTSVLESEERSRRH